MYMKRSKKKPGQHSHSLLLGASPLRVSLARHGSVLLHLIILDTTIAAALLTVVVVVAVSVVVAVIIVTSVIRAWCGRHNSGERTASSSDSRGRDNRARQRGNTEQAEALGELAGHLPQEKVHLVSFAAANLLQQLAVLPLSISSSSTSSISSSAPRAHRAHHAVEHCDVGSQAREQSYMHLKGHSVEGLHVLLQQENVAQKLFSRLWKITIGNARKWKQGVDLQECSPARRPCTQCSGPDGAGPPRRLPTGSHSTS
jgi:hypothetical protein